MSMFAVGDLVLTLNPESIGEVIGYAAPDGALWRWGTTVFPRGPYVVNIGRIIAGFVADDLSFPNRNQKESLAWVWGAVWPTR